MLKMYASIIGGKYFVREISMFPWKILNICERIEKAEFCKCRKIYPDIQVNETFLVKVERFQILEKMNSKGLI